MKSTLSYLLRVVVVAVLLVSNVSPLLAQNATGSIKGVVKDQQEAIIVSAAATATNKATGAIRKMNAGGDGIFVFESLLPGQYEVKVEIKGFATQTQTLLVGAAVHAVVDPIGADARVVQERVALGGRAEPDHRPARLSRIDQE